MSTTPDPKTMAKSLRAELRSRHQVELTHSQCLELVARQYGLADWNVLAAQAAAPAQAWPWGAANRYVCGVRRCGHRRSRTLHGERVC